MTRMIGMSPSMKTQHIVVGISGATGFAYGVCGLRLLRTLGLETHPVVSRAGDLTREYDSNISREEVTALADVVHPIVDVGGTGESIHRAPEGLTGADRIEQ